MRTESVAPRVASSLLVVAALASAQTPAHAVTFTKFADCYWRAKEPTAAYDRVTISPGDHLFIVINDPMFRSWSESQLYNVELSANHSSKRARIRDAWADVVPGLSTLSGYLSADAQRLLGGAKSVQLWRRGKLLLSLPLENTPSTKQLNSCGAGDLHDDEAEEQ